MADIRLVSDSDKLEIGGRTNGDLNLYHNGTNSFIENETGILYVTNKDNTSLILGTNDTTALTIDSSQVSTFSSTVLVPEYIKHDGDTDTSIRFLSDNVVVYAGNENMIDVSSSAVVINEGGGDNDFRVETSGNTHGFHIDAGNNVVNINAPLSSQTQSTPQEVLALKTFYTGSADGAAGAGSLLSFYIPDDETNPIKGAGIAGLKENADDSSAETALAFYISQNDATLDEAMRITSDNLLKIGTSGFGSAGTTLKQLGLAWSTSTYWDSTNTGTFTGMAISNPHGDAGTGAGIQFSHGASSSGISYIVSRSERATSSGGDRSSLHFGTRGSDGVDKRMTIGDDGNVNVLDGNLIIGTSGHGIDFSAHGNASGMGSELLDDYEEGTWTPVVNRITSAPTISYAANRYGAYTKIGNMVFATFDVTFDSTSGGSGSAILSGLPFTVSDSNDTFAGYSVLQVRAAAGVAAGSSGQQLKGFAQRNAAYIYLQYDNSGSGGFDSASAADWGSSGRFTGYIMYTAA